MRVLMLVSEAPPIMSGIARVAGELTDRLRHLGVHVDVISANEIPRATVKEFRFSSLGLRWAQVQKTLGDYDILHIHGSVPTFSDTALILGRLGTRLASKVSAIVYTHHCDIDLEGLDPPVRVYNNIHHRLIRLADHVVASTPSYALQLEATARPGKVSAVPFGVNGECFANSSRKPDRFTVLFVGQLRPYKGVDVLLRAWQKVENADLHIVGTGHEAERLSDMVKDLGLRSVHLHGAVSDQELARFYDKAHVLVLPSTRKAEAFGLVLLEGMVSGCIPIASELPGVTDVVGTTGMTFPVGDSDALADMLLRLRDDPELRRQLGQMAVERAPSFNWDYTARAYLGIYKQAYLGRMLELGVKAGDEGKAPTPEALQDWLKAVARNTGADRATLMLRARNSMRILKIVASVNAQPGVVSATALPVGQRIAGRVALTGKPQIIRRGDATSTASLHDSDGGIASSVVLPLTVGGRTIGVLNLARNHGRAAFTEEDKHWLYRLCFQVAPIIRNYRERPYGLASTSAEGEDIRVPYRTRPESQKPKLRIVERDDAPVDQPAVPVPALPFGPAPVHASDTPDHSALISLITEAWANNSRPGDGVERAM